MGEQSQRFVSRAGEKLDAAMEAFGLDVRSAVCADFGCNVGGFTDCLLKRGAAKVYAIDTGYGALAWKLRKDSRVVVMERTNALYFEPPEPVDLVTIDMAWTVQQLAIPAARRWLKQSGDSAGPDGCAEPGGGRIVALLKPHYELAKMQSHKPASAMTEEQARGVCLNVCQALAAGGCVPAAVMQSVLIGKGGNCEFLLLV
ncbi:MAG: SAM-dependent methyltransferase [Phycisphaerae bacterium]|jgi:23S rRNA (cytidine1920-2'-O)/16S rRNA (cytidine1409-2'-O)-methyltransferase